MTLRTVNVTRYITPLREGGSLPPLTEADDDFKYVVKFRGAGHGVKALISELIGGAVAKLLKLRGNCTTGDSRAFQVAYSRAKFMHSDFTTTSRIFG